MTTTRIRRCGEAALLLDCADLAEAMGVAPQDVLFIGDTFALDVVGAKGVGMDAAKAVVESLGGRIAVHTRAGQGTLIVIRLPGRAPAVRQGTCGGPALHSRLISLAMSE